MSDFILREYRDEDIPALAALWNRVFGDSESLVRGFFRLLPSMGAGVLAEIDGKIVGAAYMLRGMDHVHDGKLTRCAYIYAVATDEAYRGRGIGAAVTKKALDSAKQWNAQLISTLPAEASLYKWYEELIGVKPALYRKRSEILGADHLSCRKVRASEYLVFREELLKNREHLSISWHITEFQRLLCEEYGGGLFLGEDFAAFAYVEDGTALIKELVCKNEADKSAAAASVAYALGAEKALLFENAAEGEAYIAVDKDIVSSDCVWNLSFD